MAEINCTEARSLIHASIDGELDAVNTMRVEAHVTACALCTTDRARLLALRASIREEATRHQAPDALRRALKAKLSAQSETAASRPPALFFGRFQSWRPAAAAGFAAGAALAAGLVFLVDRAGFRDAAMSAVVAAHIRALQPGHLIDVPTSDQHVVKPWFDGKVDFAPAVKDLTDQGFDLAGGRLDYVNGRNAAVLVYRKRQHVIDLFVTLGGDRDGGMREALAPNGYNVEHWTDRRQEFWAVSDLNKGELADFAALWRER